jgi:hypothetical protein
MKTKMSTDINMDRVMDGNTDRVMDGNRDRGTDRNKDRNRDRDMDRDWETNTDRDRYTDKDRNLDWGIDRGRNKDKDRDKNIDKYKNTDIITYTIIVSPSCQLRIRLGAYFGHCVPVKSPYGPSSIPYNSSTLNTNTVSWSKKLSWISCESSTPSCHCMV